MEEKLLTELATTQLEGGAKKAMSFSLLAGWLLGAQVRVGVIEARVRS